MSKELTDHQVKLLKIVDHVRWDEDEELDLYKYHLVRRAIGLEDHVIEFELKQAADHQQAFSGQGHPTPPPGARRSPWIETWNVPMEQYLRVTSATVELSEFEPGS